MKSFKVLVAGGGAGGCSVAAKFASLPKGAVGIIDPAETHYYQPMWTLVGGGMKSLKDSSKPMSQVLPKNAVWIKDSVASFEPKENVVSLRNGEKIQYEYLVVALGMKLEYNQNLPALPSPIKRARRNAASPVRSSVIKYATPSNPHAAQDPSQRGTTLPAQAAVQSAQKLEIPVQPTKKIKKRVESFIRDGKSHWIICATP